MYINILILATIITMASSVTVEDQWREFKVKHGRNYDETEDVTRFEIFQQNIQKIENHNKKYDAGEVTYKMGINQFTDLTPEEYKKFAGGYRPHKV